MTDVVVVGSINIDLVVKATRAPKAGETISGSEFQMLPGGKGANQAIAASRLGAATMMVGCVGDDLFGRVSLDSLLSSGVNVENVIIVPDSATGTALIVVEESGENRIVIVSGANSKVSSEAGNITENLIKSAKILILQFEIPLETNLKLIELAHDNGVKILLNPAPANKIPDQYLSLVDTLVVNQTEAELFVKFPIEGIDTAFKAAENLNQHGVETVIVTLGSKGAVLSTEEHKLFVPGIQVDVVDTTGAGDTFVGGLAASIVAGDSLETAVKFAVCASGLAVTRMGAQPAIPGKDDVLNHLGKVQIQWK